MRRKSYFHIDDEQVREETDMPFERKIDSLVATSISTYNLVQESSYCREKDDIIPVSTDTLSDAIKLINYLNVEYCLIGAFAVIFYGCIRTTRDVDFIIIINDIEFIKQKKQELSALGYNVEYRKGGIDDPVGDMLVVKKGNVKIDIIIAGNPFQVNTVKNARIEKYGENQLHIAAPEDLIILKLKAGGPLDLSDVQNVYTSIKNKLNIEYIDKWAVQLKCFKEWEKIKAEG